MLSLLRTFYINVLMLVIFDFAHGTLKTEWRFRRLQLNLNAIDDGGTV